MKKLTLLLLISFLWASVPAHALEREVHIVKHVMDGDTIQLDDDRRVRLIGIDTPEMHDEKRNAFDAMRTGRDAKVINKYAGKAKRFVADAIEGKKVFLEFDEANSILAHKDKYGRLLAYVYRAKDNLFINEEIVRQGYGFAYRRFPFKYLEEFKSLEAQAKLDKKGLWS